MNSYKDYLLKAFELPKLRNEKEVKNRSANPTELFFDLMFVALFSAIAHFFEHTSIEETFLAFGLFMTTYIVWNNINMYMARFFSATHFIRFGLLIIMLPLLFITGASKLDSALNIITVSIAIFMSRIVLIVLWYFSALKNPNVTNQSFMNGVRIDLKSFLISAFVGLTCIIHPTKETLAIALYASILVEIPYIMYAYNKAYKTKYIVPSEMPKVDVKLINERNLLIMIIIFGEGVITSVNNLVLDQNDLVNTVIYPIILFITVFLFFVRIFEEMTLNVSQEITQNTTLLRAIIAFNTLLVYSLLNQFAKFPEHVPLGSKILLILAFLFITLSHFQNNYKSLKTETDSDLIKFYQLDNITLYIMLGLTAAIYFMHDAKAILIIAFLFFFIHTIAMPYRYKKFKKEIEEEY